MRMSFIHKAICQRYNVGLALALAGVIAGCALDHDDRQLGEARQGWACPVAQRADDLSSTPLDWSALTQSWHENVRLRMGDLEYFVPTAVSVPFARFVGEMTFDTSGSFTTLRLAPDDAHYTVSGTWMRSDDVIAVKFVDPRVGNVQERYRVIELTVDTFRFRKL
jgi:hypothetical protein